MGQALSHIYLHKVDFAQLLVYNQSLTTASESRLLAQWLEHRSFTGATRVRFPAKAPEIFQLCFTLLRLSCRKMGAPVRDWTFVRLKRLSVVINDDSFEEGECYGPGTLAYIST